MKSKLTLHISRGRRSGLVNAVATFGLAHWIRRRIDNWTAPPWISSSPTSPQAKTPSVPTRRPLERPLGFVHEGEVIVMNNMARLARNRDNLRRIVECLVKCGIRVEFVKECLALLICPVDV